jgi:hypothetical protein
VIEVVTEEQTRKRIGRPPGKSVKTYTTPITVAFSDEQVAEIDRIAGEHKWTRPQTIRELVMAGLKRQPQSE